MSLPAFKNVNAIVNIYSFVYLSLIFEALWLTAAPPDLITFRPTSAQTTNNHSGCFSIRCTHRSPAV